MTDLKQLARDYERVEKAIQYLETHFHTQPSLGRIAESTGLSEFHFQRLFSRWVGISPKRFLQYLTKEYAKQMIAGSERLLDAAFDAGLSGSGRLHDLFVACEAVTPGQYKSRGADLEIAYGIHPSPFGDCLIGSTERGICWLSFVRGLGEKDLLDELARHWKNAILTRNPDRTGPVMEQIFTFPSTGDPAPLHLYVQGTNFQIKVWEALLKIPMGRAVTYQDIARHIGMPKAARAVGNAVGKNPIPYLIPCHRVIRKMGEFGYYGGGPARKKAILGWEATVYHRLVDAV
ncbi:MAG: methylated-DNA--[protein]-cysteine S-methyltransferase [Desulfobacterales bacterium]|nr:methylated-DNA--[protein]-cysteine S-methyltransferase [Desulfobacterales bacterium]